MSVNSFALAIDFFLFPWKDPLKFLNPALELDLCELISCFVLFECHLSFIQWSYLTRQSHHTFALMLLIVCLHCSTWFSGVQLITMTFYCYHCDFLFLKQYCQANLFLLSHNRSCFHHRLKEGLILCFFGLHFLIEFLEQSGPQSCWYHQFYQDVMRFHHFELFI